MRYRKKPVVIEAWQIPSRKDAEESICPAWVAQAVIDGVVTMNPVGGVRVKTLGGEMIGAVGDWLIKGVKNELHPVKPDIFAATYELEG